MAGATAAHEGVGAWPAGRVVSTAKETRPTADKAKEAWPVAVRCEATRPVAMVRGDAAKARRGRPAREVLRSGR